MKFFTRVLASSVNFTATTPAFSSSASFGSIVTSSAGQTFSKTLFGSQGSLGGPTQIGYLDGVSIQGCFGQNGGTSAFPNPAGTFNLLASNTLEKPNFVVIASCTIGTTGAVMIRDSSPWYKYIDFQFIPNASMGTSAGYVTVILEGQGRT
jgi:hypothetical protein